MTVSGSGLQGVRDRLDAIGGSLEIQSSPGAGTTIAGSVPLVVDVPPHRAPAAVDDVISV
jgi:signal transduction histidine kinase